MRSLTKLEKSKIEIEITENGFMLWIAYLDENGNLEKLCLIDGKNLKTTGILDFGHNGFSPIEVLFNVDENTIQFIKV